MVSKIDSAMERCDGREDYKNTQANLCGSIDNFLDLRITYNFVRRDIWRIIWIKKHLSFLQVFQ